ncbi:MAG: hypothetical protein AB7V16_12935 [Vulcanibacillus sp.]
MKSLIVGVALILLYTIFIIYQDDSNTYQRELERLKQVADECASSGALYFYENQYSEGYKVINQTETINAIEYILKYNLKLDDNFNPLSISYWKEHITYNAYFFDDSNTSFPFLYTDPYTGGQKLITEPSVVVIINAGYGDFRLSFLDLNDSIRSSSYEYYTR